MPASYYFVASVFLPANREHPSVTDPKESIHRVLGESATGLAYFSMGFFLICVSSIINYMVGSAGTRLNIFLCEIDYLYLPICFVKVIMFYL